MSKKENNISCTRITLGVNEFSYVCYFITVSGSNVVGVPIAQGMSLMDFFINA